MKDGDEDGDKYGGEGGGEGGGEVDDEGGGVVGDVGSDEDGDQVGGEGGHEGGDEVTNMSCVFLVFPKVSIPNHGFWNSLQVKVNSMVSVVLLSRKHSRNIPFWTDVSFVSLTGLMIS